MRPGGLMCRPIQAVLLLTLLFLETCAQGRLEPPVFAASGTNVSLRSSDFPEKHRKFTWFCKADQKIVEWESTKAQAQPYYFKSKLKGRLTLDQSGTLHIRDVRQEDSSTYLLKVLTEAGTERQWAVPLRVLDPVPRPVVEIKKIQKTNNSCHLVLSCVTPNQSVNYTWYRDSGPLPEEFQGAVLEITVKPENHSSSYTCQVSNPVSHENDTVYLTAPCRMARSSAVAWIATWLVVLVPTLLSLLVT